jgi:ribosomal protein L29
MAKKVSLKEKSDRDLMEQVTTARQTIRAERFKDAMSRKASIIRTAKLEIARALTELSQRNVTVK